jgi:DNA-binding CsgD family transcriptional regulator
MFRKDGFLTIRNASTNGFHLGRRLSRPAKPVSDGEMRVVKLAVKGMTDKEISVELGLSPATVRTNWVRLRRKLGVVNRAHAIAMINDMAVDGQVQELKSRTRVMQAALDANDIGVFEWRDDGKIVMDPRTCKHFGFMETAVALDDCSFMQLVDEADRNRLAKWRGQVVEGEGATVVIRVGANRLRLIASHLPRLGGTSAAPGLLCTCSPIEKGTA